MVVTLRPHAALWVFVALVGSLFLTGCKGCRSNPIVQRKNKAPDIDELEKKKKEKEKPKEDFEFKPPRVLPDEPGEMRSFVKPGHWVTVRNFVKANNFDFQAELHTKSTDSMGRPIRVENTDFQMLSSRPAPLPKGQEKAFDTTYFIPFVNITDPMQPKSVWLARELRSARGGRQIVKEDVRQGTVPMSAYQYHVVVLTDEPDRYAFLKPLYSFQAPTAGQAETKLVYYRVIAPSIERVAQLPNHALCWTSIAYLILDDVPPIIMTSTQQQALLDWLHWGGQLIINGPTTLEKLRGSYLDPYLPAKSGDSVAITQSAIDEINDYWSLKDQRTGVRATLDIPPDKPLMGIELNKHERAAYVPHCGNLLVERRIGGGRILVTAFSLTDSRLLTKWLSLDNFMNGAVLRRPRREFRSMDSMPDTVWADFEPSFALDPRFTTTLRYFTRDAGHFAASVSHAASWEPGEEPRPEDFALPNTAMVTPPVQPVSTAVTTPPAIRPTSPPLDLLSDSWHLRGFPFRRNTGMAAWNDHSGPSDAAREALKDAAGISVPKGDFVLKVLAVYLAVLAPLNWFVFRVMGRVEWAWIAAPAIAILGTFAVVRLAQLDIGFARSTTEIAIAEMHGGFPRAHVTRYTALYTSLSTSYDVEFTDDGSLAQPFPTSVGGNLYQGLRSTIHSVSLRRDKQLRLSGFLVPSNTTRYLHCEQMQDMTGAFSLVPQSNEGLQLHNATPMALHSAGVLRRTAAGQLETAWIGDLPAKTSVPLRFATSTKPHFDQWDEAFITLSYNVQARKLLDQYDTNGDKMISKSEAQRNTDLAEQFDSIDEHRDGNWDPRNRDRRWDQSELLHWCRQSRAGAASLGQLIELATEAMRLIPGEARLIGWTKQNIPGMTIRPTAAQDARYTLLLVHLEPGELPEPKSDLRLWTEVLEVQPANEPIKLLEPGPNSE